jgi:hypothetical protein
MIKRSLFLITLVGAALLTAQGWGSTPIVSVTPDLNSLQKWNDMQGDTADPFWADDDNIYHFTCDGRGFGKQGRNLCCNKLSGSDIYHLTGELVNSMDEYGKTGDTLPDGATWKVTGQECIDGVFYAFVVRNIYGNKSKDPLMRQTSFNASLIKSTDHGKTWTRTAKENYAAPMWVGSRFGAPCFLHYGKNGGQITRDGADKYVYAISNNGFWNGGDDLILGRILRTDLPRLNVSDWSYYTGGDGLFDASWSKDIAKAQKILERPAKLGWTSPVFIPALKCYLLVSWYVTPTLKSWFNPNLVVYDFFEAEHPWGPWRQVGTMDDTFLAKGQHMYGPNICAKFQESKGDEVIVQLFTSGCPFQDQKTGLYKNWRIPLNIATKPLLQTEIRNAGDPSIRYVGAWRAGGTEFNLHDYRDNVRCSPHAGDFAEMEFKGTGIQILTEKAGDLGLMEIIIDGKSQGKLSLRQDDFPRLAQIPIFSIQGLPPGSHTLKIVNAGNDPIILDSLVISK